MKPSEIIPEAFYHSYDDNLIDSILRVVPSAQEIWFHGSRATGTHRDDSDTDILVIVPPSMPNQQPSYLDIVRSLQKLSLRYENYDIQPASIDSNIHKIAKEEGELLWPDNLQEEVIDEYSTTDISIVKHLKSQGYKLLGQGVDQSAFLEPGTGHVLKIFGTQESTKVPDNDTEKPIFSDDHKMFFEWAKYCNKNKNNPYLPKFSGFESFYWNKRVYLQIRQESLKPIGSMGTVLELMADSIDVFDAKNIDDVEENIDYGGNSADSVNFIKLKKQLGPGGLELLFSTMRRLYLVGKKNGWTFDLHKHNFMRRSDGTPVIIDPWVLS